MHVFSFSLLFLPLFKFALVFFLFLGYWKYTIVHGDCNIFCFICLCNEDNEKNSCSRFRVNVLRLERVVVFYHLPKSVTYQNSRNSRNLSLIQCIKIEEFRNRRKMTNFILLYLFITVYLYTCFLFTVYQLLKISLTFKDICKSTCLSYVSTIIYNQSESKKYIA